MEIKSISLQQEIDLLKLQTRRDFTLKGSMALAGLVAGVVAILFLSMHWAALGLALILISSYSFYHLLHNCRHSNKVLNRATLAITTIP